jgi:phosphoribosylglycinamide formyltransferase-1
LSAALEERSIGTIALAGFMRILSPWFVNEWRGRILNIHPSLLPKYRGLDTHARAIDAGDKIHGCSVHVVTEELDAGEVLGQAEVPIESGDTAAELAERVLAAEHQLYPKVLSEFVQR